MPRRSTPELPWTEEEDATLLEFRYAGWHWMDIVEYIPGRSASACAGRFRLLVEKGLATEDPPKLCHYRKAEYDNSPTYVFCVPEGDPYLQRLIAVHGKDKINRTVTIKSGT